MLINDAFDIVFMQVASRDDIDLAMTKVVNYPKGLLASADEIGLKNVLDQLQTLFEEYGEDRYRPNPLLKRMVGRLFGDLAKKKASEEAFNNWFKSKFSTFFFNENQYSSKVVQPSVIVTCPAQVSVPSLAV